VGQPGRKGSLFVISAPSGAGKTTLCRKASEALGGLRNSVSYTTRPPRSGEVPDVHYTFIGEAEFRKLISEGAFIEWAEVHGNLYGTSRRRVEAILEDGDDVMLDIDVQGARQIGERFRGSVRIFILPPSLEVLEQRLRNRMSDPDEVIERRLKKARIEIGEYKQYDYVIVNDIFEEAFAAFCAVIIAERHRQQRVDAGWIEHHFLKEE
jgi:guanylate kinase